MCFPYMYDAFSITVRVPAQIFVFFDLGRDGGLQQKLTADGWTITNSPTPQTWLNGRCGDAQGVIVTDGVLTPQTFTVAPQHACMEVFFFYVYVTYWSYAILSLVDVTLLYIC